MKKIIIGLSLTTSLLLFGADETTTMGFLDTAVADSYELHDYSKKRLEDLSQSDAALQEYLTKLQSYETTLNEYATKIENAQFQNQEEAKEALESIEKLSGEVVALAKIGAYLSSHQADNANDSYIATLNSTNTTILRLSDDIGVMADRILLMAGEIGIMADRILETQRIQSTNLATTQKLVAYSMELTANQTANSTQSANANINSMQTQGVSSATQSSATMQTAPQGMH